MKLNLRPGTKTNN